MYNKWKLGIFDRPTNKSHDQLSQMINLTLTY